MSKLPTKINATSVRSWPWVCENSDDFKKQALLQAINQQVDAEIVVDFILRRVFSLKFAFKDEDI